MTFKPPIVTTTVSTINFVTSSSSTADPFIITKRAYIATVSPRQVDFELGSIAYPSAIQNNSPETVAFIIYRLDHYRSECEYFKMVTPVFNH